MAYDPRMSTVPPFPGSLTKDMTGKEDNYRGPAVRALCQITDVSPSISTCFPSSRAYSRLSESSRGAGWEGLTQ